MIHCTIAFVIFAEFYIVQAKFPDIAELKQIVLANNLALEKAITEYKTFGFHTLNRIAKYQHDLYSKNQVAKFMKIPSNLTLDELSYDQYKTYKLMIFHSKYSSIYSNAAQISDSLKTDVLYIAATKMTSDSDYNRTYIHYSTPKEIVDKVLEVIQKEKSVLVNGRFVKPNSKLNSLYRELVQMDYFNSFYYQVIAEHIYERCALPSTGCGIELQDAIHNRMVLKDKAESFLPIDSERKVYKLLAILSEIGEAEKKMFDALFHANLGCLLRWKEDDRKKRAEPRV